MEQELLIALGANLPSPAGDPAQTLHSALCDMVKSGFTLRAVSRFFATPCMPVGAGPDYINACVKAAWTGDLPKGEPRPEVVLRALHTIEAGYDRRREIRWGSRTLDLDLLAVGQAIVPDAATEARWRGLPPETRGTATPDRLILPHPRMAERGFVLVPLCDIAPGWRHPVLGLTVREMRDALPMAERAGITAL